MLRQSSKQDLGLSSGSQNRLNSTARAEVTINSVPTHAFVSCCDDGQAFWSRRWGEDVVGVGCPSEKLGVLVEMLNPSLDRGFEFSDVSRPGSH
jgi:hypothetical protein